MKIGIFTDTYLPQLNGVAIAVDRSVRSLEKKGHTVVIVAPRDPNYIDQRKNIYRLPSVRFFETGARFALHIPNKTFLEIIKNDFDVIHAHNGGPISFLGWEIAKTKNIPYVFTYHTMLTQYTHYLGRGLLARPKFMQFLSKLICNYSDYLIAPTKAVKKELISYGVTRSMLVIPTGVELGEYQNVQKGFIRSKIHVSNDTKILLHVGRFGKEKSIDFIINAFAEIKKENQAVVLVLVGKGSAEKSLRAQTKRLHLEDSVFFLGSFSPEDMPKIYADADVFVFASQTETQGMVILESLASSLPVVAVKDTVFDEVLINGENSFLVEKDSNEFAQKVVLLLQNDKLRKKFAQKSFEKAQGYSFDNTTEQLEKIYTLLVKENKVKPLSYRRKSLKNLQNIVKPLLLTRNS